MGHAFLFPKNDNNKGGRGKKKTPAETAGVSGFSERRLRAARQVLAYSRELAEKVRDGIIPLESALAEIEAKRRAAETAEAQLAELSPFHSLCHIVAVVRLIFLKERLPK
jgi:hypothetical protein